MDDDYIIHLASHDSIEYYPENRGDGFVNSLQNPIRLDPNQSYEVALLNIYFPRDFYVLINNDLESGIDVYSTVRAENGALSQRHIFNYIPSENILVGDIDYMLDLINLELKHELKERFNPVYLSPNDIFHMHPRNNRTCFTCQQGRYRSDIKEQVVRIYINLGSRLANVLGLRPYHDYEIYVETASTRDKEVIIMAPHPSKKDGGIDYIICYSDLVEPTPFGQSMVNILDIFAIGSEGGNTGFRNVIYKPVKEKTISEVAIRLADQNGRKIHFSNTSCVTCTLRIRRKL